MAFAQFPEQQPVAGLLQRSLERERLGHAYLFTGGSVETMEAMARTLAKTLNCAAPRRAGANGPAVDSCDTCLSCRKIDSAHHPDIRWVRPESKSRLITIDQTRDLMREVQLKPTEARFKVAMLVEAERMNAQSANAFLKTLEEPPAQTIFLLLSPEPQRLLETILSRCLRLTFAAGAQQHFESAALDWLRSFAAMAAEGQKGLLNRYRLLGRLLERLAAEREAVEKTLEAASPLQRYTDLEPEQREHFEAELAAGIEAEYRRRRGDYLAALEHWLRDIWLFRQCAAEDLACFPELAGAARQVAGRLSVTEAAENLRVVEQSQRWLHTNVQELLALEVGLLKLRL
jgi:DNA polymerase-3 subunit delta'